MRRLLIVCSSIVFALALGFGCGKKETKEQPGKVPVEVKEAEKLDTTRMDSAMMESTMVDTGVTEETEMPEDTI